MSKGNPIFFAFSLVVCIIMFIFAGDMVMCQVFHRRIKGNQV
jgi:hypothetical protein